MIGILLEYPTVVLAMLGVEAGVADTAANPVATDDGSVAIQTIVSGCIQAGKLVIVAVLLRLIRVLIATLLLAQIHPPSVMVVCMVQNLR